MRLSGGYSGNCSAKTPRVAFDEAYCLEQKPMAVSNAYVSGPAAGEE